MVDEDILPILGSWHTAAHHVGFNLPIGDLERALRLVPAAQVAAFSPDARSWFALSADHVVFAIGVRPDGEVRLTSRPLQADLIHVALTCGASQATETGGAAWDTHWHFHYDGEREARYVWQSIVGSVSRDRLGAEDLDDREKFARAIATNAGWQFAG